MSSRPINAGGAVVVLVAVACFLSQTFLLPIFVYSFLSLVTAFGLVWSRPRSRLWIDFKRLIQSERSRLVVLGGLLLLAVARTSNLASLVFFLTSLSCTVLVFLIDTQDWRIKYRAAQGFVVACTVLLAAGVAALVIAAPLDGVFMADPVQGYTRFRGLNLEPSHLGFALCAAYLLILFDPDRRLAKRRALRMWLLLALWLMVALTLSPFALSMMALVSVPFLFRSIGGRLICLLGLVSLTILAGESQRVQEVLSGEDSSANFRTWGSLMIGYQQMDACGPLGCGIGNTRNVLADEPLMYAFAAEEVLALPNLLAGTMVEGGYALLLFALLAIGFAAFPPRRAMRSLGLSTAAFVLLLLFAASGSYPYDAQFWTTTGLLAALVRARTPE